MKRVLEFLKEHKYLMVLLIIVGFSVTLGLTYSNFIVTSNNHKAAEMYIGALKYSIEIDESSTNTLSVPTGETIIDVKINNLNPVDTYYKLLYLKNSNLIVEYFSSAYDLDNSNNTTKSYDIPNDSVTSSNSKTIKLQITNNSTSSQTLGLSVKGGYITNTLSDIAIPSNYSEIASINTKASTYFCKTNDTLTQGLQYVNGQYTYAYKQKGSTSNSLKWANITIDGWGVQLTDKTSTDSVISKVCTYINKKPIVSMSSMFRNSQAISIDVSTLYTSSVVYMSFMFQYSKATSIDVSNFDTSRVTDMSGMFNDSKATTINVSNFDTSKVTDMGSMFSSSQATILDVSNFDTSSVTSMGYMFSNSQATTLDVSNFDTSKVTYMAGMFQNSKAMTLDVSKFDTSNVNNMHYMFSGCQATTLDVSNFDTSKVIYMYNMFSSIKATTLDLSNFDTSNVTNMQSMFERSQATELDLSNFDTSKVTDMGSMFSNSQATTLDVSNFDTSNVTSMGYMFSGCQATTLDVSNFDTSKVTYMAGMFQNSKAMTLDLSNFNTGKVTNMGNMFYNAKNLKTIYVSDKFNTDNVTSSDKMFTSSTNLVGGAGTTYDSSHIDKTYAHIDGGTSNPGYFTDIADKDIPAPNSFATDSWKTIIKAVRNNNISKYNVGDTRTIDMGTYGTHTLRIANTSTPSECSTTGFSQSACGFVLEFADIITTHNMNPSGTYKGVQYDYGWNLDGWPASSMYTFVNNDIYNAIPSEIKNTIIDTTVVSGHGKSDTENFISTDKLYLLAPKEVYTDWSNNYDTAKDLTRALDYYKNLGTSTSNYSGAIKKKGTSAEWWWLHAATSVGSYSFFYVNGGGKLRDNAARGTRGVSPAFRIG